MKSCEVCHRDYEYNSIYRHGHNTTKCNSCVVNTRRFSVKQKAVDYLGGKCQQCGYKTCVSALCFHHKDPSKKDFAISSNHCLSLERIKIELDKCLLLCANCHAEVHESLRIK
jgi:hypothetical protein